VNITFTVDRIVPDWTTNHGVRFVSCDRVYKIIPGLTTNHSVSCVSCDCIDRIIPVWTTNHGVRFAAARTENVGGAFSHQAA